MRIQVIVSANRIAKIVSDTYNTPDHIYNAHSSLNQFEAKLRLELLARFEGAQVFVNTGFDKYDHEVVCNIVEPPQSVMIIHQLIEAVESSPGAWLVEDRLSDVQQLEAEAQQQHQFFLAMTDGSDPVFQFDSLTRVSEDTAWALYRSEEGGSFHIAHLEDGLVTGFEPISKADLCEYCQRVLAIIGE